MYLDPGFGSMIIQGIIAVIAGTGAYLILMRKRIAAFFNCRKAGGSVEKANEETAGSEHEGI